MLKHTLPAIALFAFAASPAYACPSHEKAADASSKPVIQTAMSKPAAAQASSPGIDPIVTAGHSDAAHAHAGDIMIEGFWARAMLPNQPVAGGFLTLTNAGDSDDRIIKAVSPRAGRMELHEMLMEGEVMKMREVNGGIAIPAGATVELKPGGLHLMFFDIAERFEEGQTVPVTLTFEKAGEVTLDLPVKDLKAMEGEGGHQHGAADHGGHDHAKMLGGTDFEQITHIMKGQFDTPENPLSVEPVVVSGDHAIGSWAQDGRGGRALLRKKDGMWTIHLCTGDAVKQAANLVKMGMPEADAAVLEKALAEAESALGADKIALFDSFEGTMMIEGGAHGDGHGAHGG
jgi:hypothetical protein